MTRDWTYEDDDKGWTLEVTVDARHVAAVKSRTNCRVEDSYPSEGGYLEDEEFTVTGFKLLIGDHVEEIPVEPGGPLQAALSKEVKRSYDTHSGLREDVYALFED